MLIREIEPLPFTPSKAIRALLYTVVFNTAIAMLLAAAGFGASFLRVLLFSQCIGLSICLCVMITAYFSKTKGLYLRGAMLILALSAGAVGGTLLGAKFMGVPCGALSIANRCLVQTVAASIILGAIITYFFHNKERLAKSIEMVQEERMKRLSSEKLALEANLKRLQAQIEPHFLFNTLSNIVSLMDTDVENAKSMQMDLIRYLRTALGRSRDQETTLGQEIDMIRAYLNIFKIRMGSRLQYKIDIPEALRNHSLPPMLIQPLVENALLHGLEPKIDGGQIDMTATTREDRLRIAVSDTGDGLAPHHRPGVGLTNVKQRLTQLYGAAGHLSISENRPTGVTATIEVPL